MCKLSVVVIKADDQHISITFCKDVMISFLPFDVLMKYGEIYPRSNFIPSITSNSSWRVFPSCKQGYNFFKQTYCYCKAKQDYIQQQLWAYCTWVECKAFLNICELSEIGQQTQTIYMSTLMHFYLSLFSVISKTLSILVWTLLLSYHFHKDNMYMFYFGSTFGNIFTLKFVKNTWCLSVDRRPKCSEMYVVSNENVEVMTGPQI